MRTTYRRPSINKRLIPVIVISAILLLSALAIIAVLASGILYKRIPISKPQVSISEGISEVVADSPLDAEDMLDRTKKVLADNRGSSPFIVSWYLLPGNIATQTESMSEYLLARDQILLLRAYIACDRKEEANVLLTAIDTTFRGQDGLLLDFLRTADQVDDDTTIGPEPTEMTRDIYRTASVTNASGEPNEESSGTLPMTTVIAEPVSSYSDTLSFVGALLLYYDKWGTSSDMERIREYADTLYVENLASLADLRVPAPTPTPAPTQVIIDNPDLANGIIDEEIVSFIPLSSLDLTSLQMLSSIDSRFESLYTKATDILVASQISDEIPLPAEGYDPQTGGYLYVSDRTSSFRLDRSVLALLYMSETQAISPDATSWLKEQLLNQRMLYSLYDVITGNATSEIVAMDAYPLAFSVGVLEDDPSLCAAALVPMEQALATNSKSDVKGMLFRSVLSSRVAVYARENLLAIIALSSIPETR